MLNLIKKFYKDEEGATMVEYAIMVALIAVAVAATVILVSDQMNLLFTDVVDCIEAPSEDTCVIDGVDD